MNYKNSEGLTMITKITIYSEKEPNFDIVKVIHKYQNMKNIDLEQIRLEKEDWKKKVINIYKNDKLIEKWKKDI